MNLIIVLTALAISITLVESTPLPNLRDLDDDRTCFMRIKNPWKLIPIPCNNEADAISQIYYFINGNRFDAQPDLGNMYFNNLAEFLMELKQAAQENLMETLIPLMQSIEPTDSSKVKAMESDSYEILDESKESANETVDEVDNTQSGRRTFGAIIPMAEIALKAIGGDFGFNFPTRTDIEIERQTRAQEEQLSTFRAAQEHATLEALETKQQLLQLAAQASQVSRQREDEISSLKSLVSSLKSSQERDQMDKSYRELLLERDSKALEREIDYLKRRVEIDQLIQANRHEEFEKKYEIERSVKDNIDKFDIEVIREGAKTGSTIRSAPECEICG